MLCRSKVTSVPTAHEKKRRVRFNTTANLVNELLEARQHNAVRRVLARWLSDDVIVLDDVRYVPLADIGAEFLFRVGNPVEGERDSGLKLNAIPL